MVCLGWTCNTRHPSFPHCCWKKAARGFAKLCILFPATGWHRSCLLPPAPACCGPFAAHLCGVFRDLLPGTKQLPFGYSHLASGEAGAMQVPSALPKIAELPLAVGFQLRSARGSGREVLREPRQEGPALAFLQGTAGTGCGCPTGVQQCGATNMWEHNASASGEAQGLPKPDTSFSLPPARSRLPANK